MSKINWGIIGLGKIAHQFAKDMQVVTDAELYAVASRTQSKANEFKDTHHAKKAYGSYEDLLRDDKVDVIYIATPHVFHAENSIATMKAGKAVLCEKAFAMNQTEVQNMIDIAKDKNVFLMEALWTNFMPTLKTLKRYQEEQTFGTIKNLKAEFCFKAPFDPEKRLFNPKLGGGALLDIGIYPVYLALKLLGKPKHILAESKLSKTGVDTETKITFQYANGTKADLFCSFEQTTASEAIIEFEEATIKLSPRFHETDKLSIIKKNSTTQKDFNYKAKGYHFEIEHVNECLKNNIKESPLIPLDFSLDLIKTLDEIRSIIGLKYS